MLCLQTSPANMTSSQSTLKTKPNFQSTQMVNQKDLHLLKQWIFYWKKMTMCTTVSLRVRQNCAFVVDTKTLLDRRHRGIHEWYLPRIISSWAWYRCGKNSSQKVEIDSEANHVFHLSINSKNHADLSRSICILMD